MAHKYIPQEIEPKWQARWKADDLYRTPDPTNGKPKQYVLDMYPYPSGDGLSVGHARNYCATDVFARYFRMKGFNVLHPMGFDAFGLPTENAAIKFKLNPHELNERFTTNFRRQMDLLGLSYDWSLVLNTATPEFYKWTQWIFLRFFNSWYDPRLDKAVPIDKLEEELAISGSTAFHDVSERSPLKYPLISAEEWRAMSRKQRNATLMSFRLAYRGNSTVNWDPVDKVVVANEEVENGRAWRSGALVEKKVMRQWYFRITAYADRLVHDLELLDWPNKIVLMQRNWVGRSEGAEVHFDLAVPNAPVAANPASYTESIEVFTTRPDTLWGATFMVLSPEHPLVAVITTQGRLHEVEQYVIASKAKTDDERTAENKDKTGVFTGAFAINPANDSRIPIWIADYVLTGYGTGAIMAVPWGDQRDWEFAKKYHLPIIPVVYPNGELNMHGTPRSAEITQPLIDALVAKTEQAVDGEGVMINSGPLNGMRSQDAIAAATAILTTAKHGRARVNYRLRDWLISRQRYWGTPIPIIHTDDGEVLLDEAQLPLELPNVQSYEATATGESPLATISEWVNTPTGRRETDTMATWACSSWYFLRFMDRFNDQMPFSKEAANEWGPVDTYVGGAEHAVLHLLYARMWMKVMFDLGYASYTEPFRTLRNQGMILGAEPVVDPATGKERFEKMSKSKGNVIAPDGVVAEDGADALRGFELFISDFTQQVPWNTKGVPGVRRWLERVWRLVLNVDDEGEPARDIGLTKVSNSKDGDLMSERELRRITHHTIAKVGHDIESFAFNTVISALMEFTNALGRAREAGLRGSHQWMESVDAMVRMVAPVAPHMAEEMWEAMGHPYSIHQQSWPIVDQSALVQDHITIVVQVQGKIRDRITVMANTSDDSIKALALGTEGAKKFMGAQIAKQVVYVKGRLVNIVL